MAFTSITDARDAILSHFKTAWDAQTSPVPTVYYAGTRAGNEDLPNQTSPWVRISVAHAISGQATLGGVGNRRFRKVGTVTIEVRTPIERNGLTSNDRYVKVAVDAFEGESTVSGGGTVWYRNVSAVEIGADGSWWLSNVTADFEYDIIK